MLHAIVSLVEEGDVVEAPVRATGVVQGFLERLLGCGCVALQGLECAEQIERYRIFRAVLDGVSQ